MPAAASPLLCHMFNLVKAHPSKTDSMLAFSQVQKNNRIPRAISVRANNVISLLLITL
jgi:hypothetical protein